MRVIAEMLDHFHKRGVLTERDVAFLEKRGFGTPSALMFDNLFPDKKPPVVTIDPLEAAQDRLETQTERRVGQRVGKRPRRVVR